MFINLFSKKNKKYKTFLVYIFLIFIGLFASSVVWTFGSKQYDLNENLIWINTRPIKCLGNPWEFDWLKRNKGGYTRYPLGKIKEFDEEEARIMKDFYQKKGIRIIETKTEILEENISCAACNCPQGYTLFSLVGLEDAVWMRRMGWSTNY